MNDHIAILDKEGIIRAVNNAPRKRLSRCNGVQNPNMIRPGVSYLDVCSQLMNGPEGSVQAAIKGILSVIKRKKRSFLLEYECAVPPEERWFQMRVMSLKGSGGGTVVVCTDITWRKRNEEVIRTVRDVTDARRAEIALRESEERYRSLVTATAQMVWKTNIQGEIVEDIPTWRDFTGQSEQEIRGCGWADALHPGDRRRTEEIWSHAVKTCTLYETEYRVRRRDGEYRYFSVRGVPVLKKDGSIREWVGTCRDITDRKLAEEKLRESDLALRISQRDLRRLAGRLLMAEEEERRRVARELHDDFTQRLAALAIETGKFKKNLSAKCPDMVPEIDTLKEQIVNLSAALHHLSRDLHPSIIDDLGMAKAIESECTRFAQQEGMDVSFMTRGVPNKVNKEVSVPLYRIVQEALRNVVKHAQTRKARVSLIGSTRVLRLYIEDEGIGFDPKFIKARKGLGIASMKERVRLLRGAISVESSSGRGTMVLVEVPLKRRIL
ncbi:MAG: hypothetical protein C0392_15995 [Syntrophus sp. (in: bacteria)]|nr:hypothetical protein [Syntrophus sp. (in: bacteria)]